MQSLLFPWCNSTRCLPIDQDHEPARVKGCYRAESRVSRSADFAATPLLTRKCWENSGKLVCDWVAVAAKIRYPDVSFFKDQTKSAIPRSWRAGRHNEARRFWGP